MFPSCSTKENIAISAGPYKFHWLYVILLKIQNILLYFSLCEEQTSLYNSTEIEFNWKITHLGTETWLCYGIFCTLCPVHACGRWEGKHVSYPACSPLVSLYQVTGRNQKHLLHCHKVYHIVSIINANFHVYIF